MIKRGLCTWSQQGGSYIYETTENDMAILQRGELKKEVATVNKINACIITYHTNVTCVPIVATSELYNHLSHKHHLCSNC